VLLLTRAVVSWPSRRLARNLKWLNRLRKRAAAKLTSVADAPAPASGSEDDVDVELVGWFTRLVERASSGSQTVRTILSKTVPSPNVLSLPPNFDINSILGPDTIAPDALNLSFQSPGADVSTDALVSCSPTSTDPQLHQFWDPMLNILPTMGPDPLVDEAVSARECAT
jgi:hypothetical protein